MRSKIEHRNDLRGEGTVLLASRGSGFEQASPIQTILHLGARYKLLESVALDDSWRQMRATCTDCHGRSASLVSVTSSRSDCREYRVRPA